MSFLQRFFEQIRHRVEDARHQVEHPPTPEPPTVPVHVVVWGSDGIVSPAQARLVLDNGIGYNGVQVGPQVHFDLQAGTQYGWGASLLLKAPEQQDYHERITLAPDINVQMQPASVALPPLVRNGQFYYRPDGSPFTIIECSAFRLYERFLNGEDITPFLADCQQLGFNTLRVWLLNTSVGHILPSEHPNFYERLPDLLTLCGRFGQYVEFTVFTQTQSLMPSLAEQQAHYDQTVVAIGSHFVFIEGVNENDSHDNAIDPNLRMWKPAGATFDLCRGSNGSDAWVVEPVLESARYHSNDANEWWRKPKSAMEMADQYRVPAWANENTRPDHDPNPHHHEDAARVGCLLSAGYCHHDESGKHARVRTGLDRECAIAAVTGAQSVDLSQRVFPYQHPQDLETDQLLRVYQRGTAIAPVRKE